VLRRPTGSTIARKKNEQACRGGGRHPPRTGRTLPGQVQEELQFPATQSFRAIQYCRTAALGGHLDACLRCGHQAISYNSCRNRHCPKCQARAREQWLNARERELLATDYFHVVFTVPHELNVLALENPRLFYDLLFTASAQTLLEVARSVFCIRGAKTSCCIRTFTALFRRAESLRITLAGYAPVTLSFCRSRFSAASFAASSAPD
jgi:Transposase zinc-binding domain